MDMRKLKMSLPMFLSDITKEPRKLLPNEAKMINERLIKMKMDTRKLRRSLWNRGKLLDKKGKPVAAWPSTVLPVGLHPTKGWGVRSRKGRRSNRTG